MDLEKLASRARSTLLAVSFVGLLIIAFGVVLIWTVASHATGHTTLSGADWIDGMMKGVGPMVLVATGLLIAVLPWALSPVLSLMLRRALDSRYRSEQLLGTLEGQRQLLDSLRETTALSDAAKQVAYRAKDLEALRQAIREDMERQDFEAATILANEMERRFGYGKEADKWRDQINATSAAAISARVRETVDHAQELIRTKQWAAATKEADRLRRQFPDHEETQKLRDDIDFAKDNHKRDLLKDWKDAIARDDVDASVRLLKQLDQYLSPSEAEAYKESARDVFRKRLQQLNAQFALHVHEKNWGEALRTGQTITDEFPNTRMAAEVREKLPVLQAKAQQPAGTGLVGSV